MGAFTEQPIYAQLARMGKALSNPARLRLLHLLEQREQTVEELAGRAGVGLKNTSAQLQQLRAANLVAVRRDGTRMYYRLADPEISRFLGVFEEFAEGRLADLRDAVAAHLGDPAELWPVSVAELKRRLDDPGTLLLDVRSAADYADGHVPGAVSVPFEQLADRLAELPTGGKVIAYCQGPYCVVSPKAVRLLRDFGYSARPLAGGFTAWQRSMVTG
ncbi:ArsR family transcriptional regulator [Tamaricihabitans halophyticus]|uniref:ArsR family transcriptional regulator n=1 Tax=Tamaricihabitans halophyticus TaxID=1262583 RepID=A0A4V2SV53_9PSEU|nr:metalloregulator ArsR/SmtB family transcription factor [Tamaricihabitans halophyticus]TCP57176.1 ArsR family transcriptional regulator [Tamaricihabitans halophyticus]